MQGESGLRSDSRMRHGDIITSFQAITGEHPIMKLKAFGIGAALAAVALTGSAGFAQNTAATQKPASCPAEGFTGGFSHGCPQKQFANPADISAMMAALPDKPYATPQSLRQCAGPVPSGRLGAHVHPTGRQDG